MLSGIPSNMGFVETLSLTKFLVFLVIFSLFKIKRYDAGLCYQQMFLNSWFTIYVDIFV